jgi:tRNA-specific 2-thiouridylase
MNTNTSQKFNNGVLVGMSGGVDSSVTAALLMEQGYDVSGVTLCLYDGEKSSAEESTCGSSRDVLDAKSVCDRLALPHYVFDFKDRFKEAVIDKFCREYALGKTPNPCIDCNRFIKFREMLYRAEELDIPRIATGHYASVSKQGDRYIISRPKDISKDQTYVLYSLTQYQLERTLMPLGDLTKDEVRAFANDLGFVNANKPDSQDICFVPDGDYANFISKYTDTPLETGNFIDTNGNIIGSHGGMIRYTIGQRKGLGMGFGRPVYVVSKDPIKNSVVLGDEANLFSKKVIVKDVNFIAIDKLTSPLNCMGKLRYRQREEACKITPLDETTILAEFEKPQRAVTSGQAAVFYDGDTVIGGGTID